MLSRIKKNDLVTVISGKDKGKEGRVISIYPKKDTVLVKGVGIVTRHAKARRQGDPAGIIQEERPVALCKVMPVCSICKKAARVRAKVLDGGKKVRTCHRCNEEL
jgi:large subunit ribosomal protein L24